MSKDLDLTEEIEDMAEEDEIETEECYGDYGYSPLCPECLYAEKCKKFKEAEKVLAKKYKGKYVGTGKEKGKDRY